MRLRTGCANCCARRASTSSDHFAVTDELRALGEANLWSFDLPLDRFFEQALAMPGFRGVRELGVNPLRLVIEYDEV
jgi:hypothetical protein